jgi:hypothetical protein
MMKLRQRRVVGPNSVDPRTLRASSPSSLKLLSQFNDRSRSSISGKARVLLGVIGIFAWTYSGSSSALAEGEEGAGQEINNPGSSIPTLSNGALTNLLTSSYADEEVARYLSTLDGSRNAADPLDRDVEKYAGSHPAFRSSTNPEGFDDLLIPEAVWSLDASTGAHLDHISAGPGSDVYAVFGSRAEINDFWMRAMASSWIYNNTNKASGFFFTPIQFQVASCGGSSAERSNLDYCDNVNLLWDQQNDSPVKSQQKDSNTATQSASNNGFSSNGPASSNSTAQPFTAPLSPVIADQALFANPLPLQESLNITGPCDVFGSCAGVEIDPLEAPVDAPAPEPVSLLGDLTPTIVPPSSEPLPSGPTDGVVDPGPTLVPVLRPFEPVTTPEASTWVMTVIGFGFMAFTFGKTRRRRNNPISAIDVSEKI